MKRLESKYYIDRTELDGFINFIGERGFRYNNESEMHIVYIDDPDVDVGFINLHPDHATLRVRDCDVPGTGLLDKTVREYIAQHTSALPAQNQQTAASPPV